MFRCISPLPSKHSCLRPGLAIRHAAFSHNESAFGLHASQTIRMTSWNGIGQLTCRDQSRHTDKMLLLLLLLLLRLTVTITIIVKMDDDVWGAADGHCRLPPRSNSLIRSTVTTNNNKNYETDRYTDRRRTYDNIFKTKERSTLKRNITRPHFMVLPHGEFNSIIPLLLLTYTEGFTMIVATVSRNLALQRYNVTYTGNQNNSSPAISLVLNHWFKPRLLKDVLTWRWSWHVRASSA